MNRIGLLLIMSLLFSVINPAALPARVDTGIQSIKNLEPKTKKKALKISLAVGGVAITLLIGGIGFYYWNKKQQSHQDQEKKQTKPDTQVQSDTQARSDDEKQERKDLELNFEIRGPCPIIRIKNLIKEGANVNAKDHCENTPLTNAVHRWDSERLVPELLNLGAHVNDQNFYGDTALIKSIYTGNDKTIKILLDAGADVNIQNKIGDTALKVACLRDSSSIVKELLKAGADPDIKDHSGRTAINFTEEFFNNNKDIKLMLLEASAQKAAKERRAIEMEIVRLQRKEPSSYIQLLPQEILEEIEKRIKATDEKRIEEQLKTEQKQ